LCNADKERLQLLRQGLEINQYLKHHSIGRLLVGVLIHQLPVEFAPFFAQTSILDSFITKNEPVFQACATHMADLYAAQTTFAKSLDQLTKAISNAVKLESTKVVKCFEALQANVKCVDQCPLITFLETAAANAQQETDLYTELQLRSLSKYLRTTKNVHWYKLYRSMVAPRKGDWCGDALEAISTFVATNASGALEPLLGSIVETLKLNASLSSDASDAKSSVSSATSKEWEQFKQDAIKVNDARVKVNSAFQQIQFKFDDLHFGRIRENYNPLDVYLSNYNHS